MSPKGNDSTLEPRHRGLLRLIAYKIRQLDLLRRSDGANGAAVIHQISTSLLRERIYAESLPFDQSPDSHEKAMRSYYLVLEEKLSRGLEQEKKSLAEQILIHNWKNL